MPKKLSPEEATVMIIRRRLQQREEAKMADRKNAGKPTAANDDDIDLGNAGSSSTGLASTGSPSTGLANAGSPSIESQSTGEELSKD
jgi:hypothetical protein